MSYLKILKIINQTEYESVQYLKKFWLMFHNTTNSKSETMEEEELVIQTLQSSAAVE